MKEVPAKASCQLRWSPAFKDMSPEAEERLPLEAITKQRD
jgi:hypothetical protein